MKKFTETFNVTPQNKTKIYSGNDYDAFQNKELLEKLRNQIIVKGAITNGYQFSGSAENTNAMSPFYIKGRCGIRGEVITDSNLYSDTLCVEKAMYTLVERQRGVMSLNINTGYIPFVDVNKSVLCNFDDFHLSNQNYVIDSYNMTISQDPSMSFSLTNIGEIIFN